jgi:hypothetical protein
MLNVMTRIFKARITQIIQIAGIAFCLYGSFFL